MNLTAEKVERILVAIDASMRSYDALEAAVEFATLLQTPLTALFVEDVNLVKLSELPFAKELDRSSGVMRPLDSQSVIRALQLEAQNLQKRLSEESKKRRINLSMKIVRGHYIAAAVEMAGKSDIVFVGDSTRLFYERSSRKLDFPNERKPGFGHKPVWVFYDGSAVTRRGLALALHLSKEYGLDLVILTAEGCSEAELRGLLKGVPSAPQGTRYFVSLADAENVAATAHRGGCAVLVLPREGGLSRTPDSVFAAIKCPRILV